MRGETCLNKSNFTVMMKTEKEQQNALALQGEHKGREDGSCPPYQPLGNPAVGWVEQWSQEG